jgi:beta-lactamase superfamily II metal-dependent hydrolase
MRPPERAERGIEVLFLDVGQGDASIIRPPPGEGDAVVFDCKDAQAVIKTLHQRGDVRLAAVVFSHLDGDHIAGGASLLASFHDRLDAVYLSADRPVAGDDMASNFVVTAQSGPARSPGVGATRMARPWELLEATRDPRRILGGDDWSIHIVAPEYATTALARERTGTWEDANRYSAVMRVRMGDRAVLIGADAPLETWAQLPEQERVAEVFRIPHHGGKLTDGSVPDGWDVERLYQEVKAHTAVVSVGTRNPDAWGHPHPDWVAPIMGGRCRMMCTQVTPRCQHDVKDRGDENMKRLMDFTASRGAAPFAEPLWRHYRAADRPVPAGRRTREVPCAGTVVVRMTPDRLDVLPFPDQHDDIVGLWTAPLCRPRE